MNLSKEELTKLKTQYKKQIDELKGMGFTNIKQSCLALKNCRGDLNYAVNWIISNPMEEEPEVEEKKEEVKEEKQEEVKREKNMFYLLKYESKDKIPPLFEHTSVIYKDKFYIFGGKKTKAMVIEYNTSTKSIQIPFQADFELYSHTAVTYKDKMYIFGGWKDQKISSDFFEYDFQTHKLKTLESSGVISLQGHCAVVEGDKMYVFGGFNIQGNTTNDLYEYDFIKNTWEKKIILGEKPLGVSNAHMVVASKSIIIHGGTDSINITTSVYRINLFTFVSEKVTTNNPVQACKGGFVKLDENSLLLIGGYNKKTLKDGWIYKIEEKTWEREDFMDSLIESYSHTCLYYQDEIYIIGGNTLVASDKLNIYSAIIDAKGLFSLLFKDSWSDITVNANGYSYKCHKAVLSQAKYFDKNISEKDVSIDVEIDPYLFSKILKYMYGKGISVSGDELFSFVSIAQDLEFKELEIHCVNQLSILQPHEVIGLLERQEKFIREKRKVRFYSEDMIKNLCLETLQKIKVDSKEFYQKIKTLDPDLRIEIIVTPKIDSDGIGLIPEDRPRSILLAEHFSNLRANRKYTDCSIITQSGAYFAHKFIFLNSPYFRKAFESSPDIMLEESENSVKLFIDHCYNPEMEMNQDQTTLFERFCKKYDVGIYSDGLFNPKLLVWDTIPPNMQQTNKHTIKQNGSNSRLGYCSYVFKPNSNEAHFQFKIISYVSWVGVGVADANKIKNLDYTWNYSGGHTAHGTNLWSMNGYCWSSNQNTHSKNVFSTYTTGQVIDCKISPKKNAIFMKKLQDTNWYELPVTFPVCVCVNLGGSGDTVEILQKKEKFN